MKPIINFKRKSQMTGINGMIIDDSAFEMADFVLSGNKSGAWSTFRYSSNNDKLLGDNICTNTNLSFSENWELFVDHLTDITDDIRYAIVEFQNKNVLDGVVRSKILYVLWAPQGASVRKKIISTMHFKDVQNRLFGDMTPIIVQANDASDLDYAEILKRVQQKTTVF